MTQTIQRKLNDSAFVRWSALILIALMMFFAYMFVDMLSPLKEMLETNLHWDSSTFGTYAASEYFLNVFCFFLIFAGIILDKMGIRFTGLLSAGLMVLGACIKFYAMSDGFVGTGLEAWLSSWWVSLPASAKLSCFGFMIFGCGCEMAGTTVSKAIAKWFKGKEMAMAMGLEMSIARLGVFAAMWLAPMVSAKFDGSVSAPVLFGATLLAIGFIFYFVFVVLDRKLDKQLEAAGELTNEASEEEFKFSDLGKIFTSKMFWLVALLCVLYYSAIFPFQRYAPDFLNKTLDIDNGSQLFSCFPILAMVLTPFLGGFIDRKGKAASMLMVGSLIMIACHLCFAFVLPAVPSKALAIAIIAILGVSFSLVPAALWPSVPKIIDE
ncbi:MAG: MFS transporter, partial [Alistipes sp.]|nr:MFS transporter [Alistipes sp.]